MPLKTCSGTPLPALAVSVPSVASRSVVEAVLPSASETSWPGCPVTVNTANCVLSLTEMLFTASGRSSSKYCGRPFVPGASGVVVVFEALNRLPEASSLIVIVPVTPAVLATVPVTGPVEILICSLISGVVSCLMPVRTSTLIVPGASVMPAAAGTHAVPLQYSSAAEAAESLPTVPESSASEGVNVIGNTEAFERLTSTVAYCVASFTTTLVTATAGMSLSFGADESVAPVVLSGNTSPVPSSSTVQTPVAEVVPVLVAVSVNVSGPSNTGGVSFVIRVRTSSVVPVAGIATNEPAA